MRFDKYEDLIALHRILMSAKFSEIPFDIAVDASPLTARYSNHVVSEIVSFLQREGRLVEADEWNEWRIWHRRVRENDIVKLKLRRLAKSLPSMGVKERKNVIANLIAPFIATSEEIEALLPFFQ